MRQIMKKINTILKNNLWLSITLTIILVIILGIAWNWSLSITERKNNSINSMLEEEMSARPEQAHDSRYGSNSTENGLRVDYTDKGVILCDVAGDLLFGPCQYIYDDFSKYNKINIFRFIDENGLIGYGTTDGKDASVLVSGKFSEASEMEGITACVKEDGKQGAVCIWSGEMIIEPQYEEIQWNSYWSSEDNDIGGKVFRCKNADGTYDVKIWDHS